MEIEFWMFSPKLERGKARMEYFAPGATKQEEFGLHKRSRRQAKGIVTSRPDGTVDKRFAEAVMSAHA